MTKEGSEALQGQQAEMVAFVGGIGAIQTPNELTNATEAVKQIKRYKKDVHDYWDELVENAHKGHKALVCRRKEFLDPADRAEKDIKLKISRYYEAERKAKAEEMKKRQEAERKAAEKKRLAEVAELQDMGELEAADHIAEQPLDVVPVAPPQETEVEGLSTSYRYSAEVEDLEAFLEFLVAEPRFRYLVKDFPMKELNKLATAQKEMFDIPGVKLIKKLIPSVRS